MLQGEGRVSSLHTHTEGIQLGPRTLLAGLCGECDRHDHVLGSRAKLLRHLVGGDFIHLIIELGVGVRPERRPMRQVGETYVETAAGLEAADGQIDVEVLRVVRT